MEKVLELHSDKAEDVSTSSSFRQFQIEHFHLELSVDFEKKRFSGSETLRVQCTEGSPDQLLLDVHPTVHLGEVSVSPDGQEWSVLEFFTRDFTGYGSTLVVKFASPWSSGDKFQLSIKYAASNGPGVRTLHISTHQRDISHPCAA